MGPEWAEKLLVVQAALVEANQGGNLQPEVVAAAAPGGLVAAVVLDLVREVVVLVVLAALAAAVQVEVPSMAEMMMTPTTIPTNEGRQAILPNHQGNQCPGKNLERASLHTVDSTLVQG